MKHEAIFYLGVDGGASASRAVLSDEEGKSVCESEGKALNWHSLGKEEVEERMARLLSPLLAFVSHKQGYIVCAVFGLAGLDTKEDEHVYQEIVLRMLPQDCRVLVVNDAKIALEATCQGKGARIVVISGTGASVYGEYQDRSAKAIGWDYVLGDEGSAYSIGLAALKAATASWDARGQETLLGELCLSHLEVKDQDEFVSSFYSKFADEQEGGKRFVASFAPLVHEALLENDALAIAIRDKAAQDLALGVGAVAKRLILFSSDAFCLGRVGSTWSMEGFYGAFQKRVQNNFPNVQFSERTRSPVEGAIVLAQNMGGGS